MIKLTSIFVNDQNHALRFYTEALDFHKKADFPVGKYKWLTVVSVEDPEGTELLLEPNDNPAAKRYQKEIYDQGISATAFAVREIHLEYNRLKAQGVQFTVKPTEMGTTTIAVFDIPAEI